MADRSKHWLGRLKTDTCLRYTAFFFLLAVDILAIVAMSIGITYQGQCQINENISIFLIVGGVIFTIYFTSLLVILYIIIRSPTTSVEQISKAKRRALSIYICLVCLFMTAWLITGCVWVFGVKPIVEFHDSKRPKYCRSILYDYAFFYCIFLLIICSVHYFSCCWIARN